ncbi:MAG: c-type cytochrome [Myxococcota bacterium]
MARRRRPKKRGRLRVLFRVVLVLAVISAVLGGIGAGVLALVGMPTYEAPSVSFELQTSPEHVARGKRLVSMLCNRCHFDGKTDTLSGRSLDDITSRLGDLRAPNITRDPEFGIGSWTPGELALLLRTGLHPKTELLIMPPVMPRWPKLADDDLMAIVAFLYSDDPWVAPTQSEPEATDYSLLATLRSWVTWSPLSYPRTPIEAPSRDGLEKYGAYLVDDVFHCAMCHTDDWTGQTGPELRSLSSYMEGDVIFLDVNEVILRSANLTPHETGLAGWTGDAMHRALVEGFDPDGNLVRWPMPRYPGLSRSDSEAIFAYLQTVTPVENEWDPSPPYRIIGRKAAPGRHLYMTNGCHYCHGDREKGHEGLADLRGIPEERATVEACTAFVKNPRAADPFHPMPAWEGVIAEDEYPDLCEYVLSLGKRAPIGK